MQDQGTFPFDPRHRPGWEYLLAPRRIHPATPASCASTVHGGNPPANGLHHGALSPQRAWPDSSTGPASLRLVRSCGIKSLRTSTQPTFQESTPAWLVGWPGEWAVDRGWPGTAWAPHIADASNAGRGVILVAGDGASFWPRTRAVLTVPREFYVQRSLPLARPKNLSWRQRSRHPPSPLGGRYNYLDRPDVHHGIPTATHARAQENLNVHSAGKAGLGPSDWPCCQTRTRRSTWQYCMDSSVGFKPEMASVGRMPGDWACRREGAEAVIARHAPSQHTLASQ